VLFNAPNGDLGALMDDIKSFRQGGLLHSDDEVLLSWGNSGEPTWIQVIIDVSLICCDRQPLTWN